MTTRLANQGDTIYFLSRHGPNTWDNLVVSGMFIEYKGLCTGGHYTVCVIHPDGLYEKHNGKPIHWSAAVDEIYFSYDAVVAAWEAKQLARAANILQNMTEFAKWRESRDRILDPLEV
jgi:hypothetical protein